MFDSVVVATLILSGDRLNATMEIGWLNLNDLEKQAEASAPKVTVMYGIQIQNRAQSLTYLAWLRQRSTKFVAQLGAKKKSPIRGLFGNEPLFHRVSSSSIYDCQCSCGIHAQSEKMVLSMLQVLHSVYKY